MSFALIDVTDTAAAMGYHCPVSVENAIPAVEVAQVLTAAREAVAYAPIGSSRIPFHINRFENGVISAADMVMILGVDQHGRPAATILA
ncbi:hypothetical protein [Nocardia terpenica]|uniref:Uncharacterized protein n=1 Tax=Nocardia terpenica TaxID=455432 RepID=A0A291RZ01_9NOCA|nr:hypothetical protein [Nocardia terpenica]ATL72508.1 hypothetical protein CRH09_39740 [Nocardia terpenica]